jgi:ubiquilin
VQLARLREMGFLDDAQNLRALVASNGNVNAAIEWLLSNS